MYYKEIIVDKANRIIKKCGCRDPYKIAEDLKITVIPHYFKKQRGAYKVIQRNRFIFINTELEPVMEKIVLLHEIGHDTFHREMAIQAGSFQEFNIFDMRNNRTEYEANVFAAQIALPDEDILECIERGYDIEQIARALYSDINLVALKVDILNSQGYKFNTQDHRSDFLKYR